MLKHYLREVTPPLIWRAAKTARRAVKSRSSRVSRWTYGVEQPVEFYDEKFYILPDLHRHYTESKYYPLWTILAERIHCYEVGNILDIGCGTGQLACLLRDQGVPQYTGLDFSAVRIARAREICPEYEFFVEDARRTDLIEKRGYDAVVTTEFLEHIEADLEVLQRIPRGPRVLATVPNYAAPGHVRYFETAADVQRRYRDVLNNLRVDIFFADSTGRIIFILDGMR